MNLVSVAPNGVTTHKYNKRDRPYKIKRCNLLPNSALFNPFLERHYRLWQLDKTAETA